jgi:hypothetical protein
MEYGATESSPRKLVWVEGQKVAGWGCSNCAWVFRPPILPIRNSIQELTTHAQNQLDNEFASHNCAAYPRSEAAAS